MDGTAPGSTEADSASVPPIEDDERLYRRVLPGWYQPGKTKKIPQRAFMPRAWKSEEEPGDETGLSVSRKNLTTIEGASTMPRSGKQAHVAEFGVSDVHELQLTVKPDSLPNDRSHALIPEMNSHARRDPLREEEMEEWAIALRDRAAIVYEAPSR